VILACLLAEGEEKFFTVRALQTAAKNFDQGKEDFSSVIHFSLLCSHYIGSCGS
jgi:hypothetical protein